MQSGNLGIQATGEPNNTETPKRTLPSWGEAHKQGGRGQNTTHPTTPATQKERGEEPGGSRGQSEKGHTRTRRGTNVP